MNKIRPTTSDAILEAAFQVFNRKPAASLADVAKRAGVGRATLHRHFRTRDDLILALARTATEELDEAVELAVKDADSHGASLKLALDAVIPLAERQWFLSHEPVDQDPDIARACQESREFLIQDIEGAKTEGVIDKDLPTDWIAEVYENLIYAAWTQVRDGKATPSQAADLAWRTFINGTGIRK